MKVPCADERDFYARLGDHIAERGLRVPTDVRRPVGSRVEVALEFRNGGTLRGEAIVDAVVQLDECAGMNVRFVRLDRGERAIAPQRPPPLPGSKADVTRGSTAGGAVARAPAAIASVDLPFEDEVSFDVDPQLDPVPPLPGGLAEGSGARGARSWRAVVATAGVALALATAGWLVGLRLGRPPAAETIVAAHLQAADTLVREGRVTGRGSALDHLLAAKLLRPHDPATNERLSRLADMLETLGGVAIERGDLAVAAIHLEGAREAAPDRPSLRAKLAALEKRRHPAAPRAKHSRAAAAAR